MWCVSVTFYNFTFKQNCSICLQKFYYFVTVMCDFTYTLCCDCGDNFYKLAVYVANVFRLCTEHDIMYLGM